MTEDRRIRLEVEVPATPEQAWEAIATGDGISSWFVPAEVAEREGGRVSLEFAPGMVEEGEVTAWEPPHRFAYVAPTEGERRLAYEWLVEARAGGTCVVRLVNSGFGPGADWDAEYDGMTRGWTMFLQMLRLSLAHFPGAGSAPVLASAASASPPETAWPELCDALGLEGLAEGPAVRGDGGPQPLAGEVAWTAPEMRLLRLEAPAAGLALVAAEPSRGGSYLSVWLYPREAGVDGDAWRAWMAERFPAPDRETAASG